MYCRTGRIQVHELEQPAYPKGSYMAQIVTGGTRIVLKCDDDDGAFAVASHCEMAVEAQRVADTYGIKIVAVECYDIDRDVQQAMAGAEQEVQAPWVRDDDQLTLMLHLAGVLHGDFDPVRAGRAQQVVATWTDEQCRQAEEWAGAIHLAASDNDIPLPVKPAHVAVFQQQFMEYATCGDSNHVPTEADPTNGQNGDKDHGEADDHAQGRD